jgi:hypothetical protein
MKITVNLDVSTAEVWHLYKDIERDQAIKSGVGKVIKGLSGIFSAENIKAFSETISEMTARSAASLAEEFAAGEQPIPPLVFPVGAGAVDALKSILGAMGASPQPAVPESECTPPDECSEPTELDPEQPAVMPDYIAVAVRKAAGCVPKLDKGQLKFTKDGIKFIVSAQKSQYGDVNDDAVIVGTYKLKRVERTRPMMEEELDNNVSLLTAALNEIIAEFPATT